MHKILKSLLPTEDHVNSFQRLVNAQIEEMRAHKKHMANVKKDPETFQEYPAPGAHPDVMNAIVAAGDDFNIEFEIVDDTPVPTLEEKKAALRSQLNKVVFDAQEKIMPTPKYKLLALKANKSSKVEAEKRTKEQIADVAAMASLGEKFARLSEYHTQIDSDIYDLEEPAIDKYKIPALPEELKR